MQAINETMYYTYIYTHVASEGEEPPDGPRPGVRPHPHQELHHLHVAVYNRQVERRLALKHPDAVRVTDAGLVGGADEAGAKGPKGEKWERSRGRGAGRKSW